MGINIAGDMVLTELIVVVVIIIFQHSCSVYDVAPVEGVQCGC